jgi:excisionase family DNA binding protein
MTAAIDRCLTPKELARRWRCRVTRVRAMVRTGQLPAITIGGRTRITPEAVTDLERGPLAVRPRQQRKREMIPKEVLAMLEGD